MAKGIDGSDSNWIINELDQNFVGLDLIYLLNELKFYDLNSIYLLNEYSTQFV